MDIWADVMTNSLCLIDLKISFMAVYTARHQLEQPHHLTPWDWELSDEKSRNTATYVRVCSRGCLRAQQPTKVVSYSLFAFSRTFRMKGKKKLNEISNRYLFQGCMSPNWLALCLFWCSLWTCWRLVAIAVHFLVSFIRLSLSA